MNTGNPQELGFSPTRLQRIAPAMQGYVDRRDVAGIVTMIARRGQIVHQQCFGMMDLEAGKPMQADTIVRMYSMSKPVTAAALLMLYEEGHFRLDEPVYDFIPGFKHLKVVTGWTASGPSLVDLERPLTIRHLMTHTSGVPYPNPDGTPAEVAMARSQEKMEQTHDAMPTLEQWTDWLVTLPLAHQPGSGWTYGFSIDVLGRLVEVISGMTFDAFLQQRMFGPLGMVDTGFYVPAEKVGRLAALYARKEDRLELVDPPTGEYARPRAFLSGGGGLVSTAGDYLRFAQMLLNGGTLEGVRLLSRKTVDLMASNHLPAHMLPFVPPAWPFRTGYGMGLGVRVVVDVAQSGMLGSVGSFTWQGYASTDFWVDPKEQLVGMMLPQSTTGPNKLQEDYRVLVYQALDD